MRAAGARLPWWKASRMRVRDWGVRLRMGLMRKRIEFWSLSVVDMGLVFMVRFLFKLLIISVLREFCVKFDIREERG